MKYSGLYRRMIEQDPNLKLDRIVIKRLAKPISLSQIYGRHAISSILGIMLHFEKTCFILGMFVLFHSSMVILFLVSY